MNITVLSNVRHLSVSVPTDPDAGGAYDAYAWVPTRPRQTVANSDPADRHLARVDQHFDSSIRRAIQSDRKGWIEIMASREGRAVGALDQEKDGGTVAFRHHRLKFSQMFQRPRRHAIRKLSEARRSH
jgi:hypothetical protein